MGFFSKIRSGRLFFGKKEPTLLVDFTFRGTKYIVEEFDIELKQDVNMKNKPDSEVYGGIITITISETPDEWLNLWAMNSFEKRDGEFRFLMNDGRIVEGAQLKISFKEAYCVSYQKNIDPLGTGLLTTLVISPRSIRIGNEEFENRWRNN